jgi:hypothetical protein
LSGNGKFHQTNIENNPDNPIKTFITTLIFLFVIMEAISTDTVDVIAYIIEPTNAIGKEYWNTKLVNGVKNCVCGSGIFYI